MTPTTTLESGVTPSPTTPANNPFLITLENPRLINEYDLADLNKNDWEFSGVQVKGEMSVEVSGTGSWDAYLDSIFEILPNQGVLARFKYQSDTYGILALTRGDWDTESYRQWGTIFSSGSSRPIVSYGSDHSSKAEVLSDISLEPGVWYSVFFGHSNNQLVQIIWDPTNPLEYHLSTYDYGDDDKEPYYFHVAGDAGTIIISEVSSYAFDSVDIP